MGHISKRPSLVPRPFLLRPGNEGTKDYVSIYVKQATSTLTLYT